MKQTVLEFLWDKIVNEDDVEQRGMYMAAYNLLMLDRLRNTKKEIMAKVKVEMTCHAVVHISKIVEMEKADYEKLKKYDGDEIIERKSVNDYYLADAYINWRNDIVDNDREFTMFQIKERKLYPANTVSGGIEDMNANRC